jgi:hypothetical protein
VGGQLVGFAKAIMGGRGIVIEAVLRKHSGAYTNIRKKKLIEAFPSKLLALGMGQR